MGGAFFYRYIPKQLVLIINTKAVLESRTLLLLLEGEAG